MLSDGLFQHLPPSILCWRKDGFHLAEPHGVHSALRKRNGGGIAGEQTKVSHYCKNNHSKCVNLIYQSVMLSPINKILPRGLRKWTCQNFDRKYVALGVENSVVNYSILAVLIFENTHFKAFIITWFYVCSKVDMCVWFLTLSLSFWDTNVPINQMVVVTG